MSKINAIFYTKIEDIKSLNLLKKEGLKKLSILTIKDLLYHFPSRLSDGVTQELKKGTILKTQGVIKSIIMRKSMSKKRNMMAVGKIKSNDNKVIKVVWFNQPYIAKQFTEGDVVSIKGMVAGGKELYLTNPDIEKIDALQSLITKDKRTIADTFTPTYKETANVSSKWLRNEIINFLKKDEIKNIKDPIPFDLREKLNLPNLYNSFIYIHAPKNEKEYLVAQKRFIFEAMYIFQLSNKLRKNRRDKEKTYPIEINKEDAIEFMNKKFEFAPTKTQLKIVEEIIRDMSRKTPMARILEGDVGSGKTAIAATILYSIVMANPKIDSFAKPQVAYLAPTEILAKQQFDTILKLFQDLNVPISLLTSKTSLKYPSKVEKDKPTKISKATLKKWIANGEIPIVIGTHSILQKEVSYKRLSLVIIDEQHKFGVAQRNELIKQDNYTPHLLSMTATPIPRSLALTIYGDLSLSVLDELPPGRQKPKTKIVKIDKINKVYEHIKNMVNVGKQCYIVCPRIEKDEKSGLRSVEEEYEYLKTTIFPNLKIGKIHGGLKNNIRDDIITKFSNGEIDILVTTTVIEVGVNIPKATTIVILHAERFGLSQLHQLRGRVIRSDDQPYCFAISDSKRDESLKRLKIFEEESNGFKLAEFDLEQRGTGELGGLKQSGIPDLISEAFKNKKLISIINEETDKIINSGKKISLELSQALETQLYHNE